MVVEDEEEDEVRPRKKKKRLRRQRPESPVLDEEDLDLLDENRRNQSRKDPSSSKFKRIRRGARSPSPTRRGVEEIFGDDEPEEEEDDLSLPRGEFYGFIEDDEPESEEDDLLREARRHQRERLKAQQRSNYIPADAGIDADTMEEITQLFGDGLEYQHALELSEDEEPEYAEEGEERVKEVQLKDIFEPSELKERLLTDADELIRITDEPERFQLYRATSTPVEIDIQKEASWIAERLLSREQKRRIEPELEEPYRQSIAEILNFFNNQSLEVPFIWQHRRDFLYYSERGTDPDTGATVLKDLRILIDQDDLWKVWEEDGRYRALEERLGKLKDLWEGLEIEDRVVDDVMGHIDSVEDLQGTRCRVLR
jgi:transcription elongation factor SPT6